MSRHLTRVDGRAKVTGAARYAGDSADRGTAHALLVQATIPRGTVSRLDTAAALQLSGVLTVITPENAPRLTDATVPELRLFQTYDVAYRGQPIAAVVATEPEIASAAAALVQAEYAPVDHDVLLDQRHPGLYRPAHVNPRQATDVLIGDFADAYSGAAVQVDAVYRTPAAHNHPLEPHATTATWAGERLTMVDSVQGPSEAGAVIAAALGLRLDQVRVIAEHVGGGFGSKGLPRANSITAAMAAMMLGRPVTCALARQQMAALAGHRTPTIQRVRLGAEPDGRLTSIGHDAVTQTSTVREFAEQAAVVSRHMYAAPHRRTTHRLMRLDVPTPSWMRGPGVTPGMFALESAMDELAVQCGVDPVELRLRNEPAVHPETGRPFSSRNLAACLREGAARFGWADRDPRPAARRDGRWLIGMGMAASTYTAEVLPSEAEASVDEHGRYQVSIAAVDLGTGARTALLTIAAEALQAPSSSIDVRIGDSDLPHASVAGGSMGTASWGWAVLEACRKLRQKISDHGGVVPTGGLTAHAATDDLVAVQSGLEHYSFGAQFAAVRVDADTGEVLVTELLGVFAAGRIIVPATARSQFVGAMIMGISMALHEESSIDPRFGDYTNRDLASYHIATHADVRRVEACWIDETERGLGPLGAKGIGEIGITGTAAAIANAVYHATGVRVRELPIHPGRTRP